MYEWHFNQGPEENKVTMQGEIFIYVNLAQLRKKKKVAWVK